MLPARQRHHGLKRYSTAMLKTCCGNCQSGRPCCGTKPKPVPAFKKHRGLWLPRRDLTLPKNLLQFPSEQEWSGLWRPWQPALMPKTFDLSCLPCCARDCAACDPGTATIDSDYSGALVGSETLTRDDAACGGIGNWRYGREDYAITTACSALWLTVASVCIYCDNDGQLKGVFTDPRAGCNFAPNGGVISPDEWSCGPPLSATFSFVTTEEAPGDCLCGPGQAITFTVG